MSRLPSQRGMTGAPVVPEKRPSPVRSASPAPKRIQVFSSATNAGSPICAVFPATTYSSTCSMAARSVNSITRTPLSVPARSSSRSSSFEIGLPS
jgi:hypothetical protein